MKKLLILAVVAALSFWGCSENSSLTEPTDVQQQQSFLKVNTDNVSELSVEAKSALGVDDVNTLSKSWLPSSVTKIIGEDGGVIRVLLAKEGMLSIGKLDITAGALNKSEKISVTLVNNDGLALFELGPELTYSTPALLTVGIIGVDVQAGQTINFKSVENPEEKIVFDNMIVGNGWVVLVKAQIEHHSRFGFTK